MQKIKGVLKARKVQQGRENHILIKAGLHRMYFVDAETTKKRDRMFLRVTERRRDKKDGKWIRKSFPVFQEIAKPFADAVARMAAIVSDNQHSSRR